MTDFANYVKFKKEPSGLKIDTQATKATASQEKVGRYITCRSVDSPSPRGQYDSEDDDIMPTSPLRSPEPLQILKKKSISSSADKKWWDYKRPKKSNAPLLMKKQNNKAKSISSFQIDE